MPKRCGCGDTCTCVIQAGPGVDVDGSGTVDHPYVITNAADELSEQLILENTGNVDFVTVGDGTADAPLHVSANAFLKMAELTDVADTPAPTNGQVPVWRTSQFVFETQTGSGGGGTGADEVVVQTTPPTPAAGDPSLWVDTSANAVYTPGVWTDIPLASGWKTASATSVPQYRVENTGIIRLRGTFTKNAGGNVAHAEVPFTLPTEARPLRPYYFPAMASGYVPVRIDLQTTGVVSISINTTIFTTPGANVALDGISYDRTVA